MGKDNKPWGAIVKELISGTNVDNEAFSSELRSVTESNFDLDSDIDYDVLFDDMRLAKASKDKQEENDD